MGSPADIIRLCAHVDSLKHLKRTGWVKMGIDEPETVAAHMYRMGILAMTLPDSSDGESVDVNKCVRMALVHDLAEAVVGDITPHCGVSEQDKHKHESEALTTILSSLPSDTGTDWRALWDEYEANQTVHAHLVHDLDKFDMLCQAFEYEKRTPERPRFLQQFFDRTYDVFRTSLVKSWIQELKKQRGDI